MSRILVTGMAGTGKSSVLAELGRRGYRVVDTDEPGWREYRAYPKPIDELHRGEFLWVEEKMTALLASDDGRSLFVAGGVRNQRKFYNQFDAVVLLSAPADVLLDRVAWRTTNTYGKSPLERAEILADLAEIEPILRQGCTYELDASRPLDEVVADLISIAQRGTTIEAVVGDITRADTEAIVNAANSQLWMGGGVAGAIKRAAGSNVEDEAIAQGPIEPGEAVVTSAGALPPPIRWVIHAATMGPNLQTSQELVRRATASALAAAASIGATSVALPAMGTGVGGFPMMRAAKVMVAEARLASEAGGSVGRIVFLLRDEAARGLFAEAIAFG